MNCLYSKTNHQTDTFVNNAHIGRMLPNSIREYLMQHKRSQVAMLIDMAAKHGFSQRWLSIDELRTKTKWSDYAIRQAVCDEWVSSRTRQRNNRRGRPSLQYRIPSPWECITKLSDIGYTRSSWLPDWAFSSVRAYRKAMHFVLILEKSRYRVGQALVSISRALQCHRLGVCANTVRNYERELPVFITPNIDQRELSKPLAMRLKTKETCLNGESLLVYDEHGAFLMRIPPLRAVALRWIRRGCRLLFEKILPNIYGLTPGWNTFWMEEEDCTESRREIYVRASYKVPRKWGESCIVAVG